MWDVSDLPAGAAAPSIESGVVWPDGNGAMELRVVEVTWEADGVIGIRLRDDRRRALPAWAPGAHVEVVLPSGLIRHYSLCGDPDDRTSYKVAVLREDNGRGGSMEMHDVPLVGRNLTIRGPRNHFALTQGSPVLFIAGGIGITPILPMVRSMPPDADWELYYLGRSRRTMAFVDEVSAGHADRVHLAPSDENGRIDLTPVLDALPPGAYVYCCGPAPLLKTVEAALDIRDDVTLITERFTPSEPRGPVAGEAEGAETFEVELRRTDVVLTVPPERSVLAVVRDVLPDVPFSCEEGYCGSCETRVLEGEPDHRDDILTAQERAAGKTMFICVSRACSPRLVLDL